MPGAMPDPSRGVFGISVAADLSGADPQSLRLYERRGLLEPERTAGGTRRYSAEDVERLQRIRELLDAGVNLAGIGLVLELEDHNGQLAAHNDALSARNDALRAENDQLSGRRPRRR